MTERENQLRLIEIFHYIVGGLAGLFALFPIFHLVVGLMLVFAPEKFDGHEEAVPAALGWVFVAMAGVFIVMGMTLAFCILVAGRKIKKRKGYVFCLVIAGIECMFMPFGTALGVFTLVVLLKDDVKQLFTDAAQPRNQSSPYNWN